jgi:diguanylate cyclase (GGDEF)-like protein
LILAILRSQIQRGIVDGSHAFHDIFLVLGKIKYAMPSTMPPSANSRPKTTAWLLVALLLALLVLFSWRLHRTGQDNLAIQGQYLQGKDLIADILPPPEFIVESYTVVFAIRNQWSDSLPVQRLSTYLLGKLRSDFERRHRHWKRMRPDDSLLDSCYHYAAQFYRVAETEFLPAIKLKNTARADHIMQAKLAPLYEQHHKYIDMLVRRTHATNNEMAVLLAKSETQRQRLLFTAIALLLVGFLLIVGLLLNQRRNTIRTNAQLVAMNLKLKELSLIDNLTELFNRHYFATRIVQDLAYAKRKYQVQGTSLGIMMIDIDFFKKVNDTKGHPFGDQVLKLFALRLKSALRAEDSLIRWGGEEFLLTAVDTNPHSMRRLANRILSDIRSQPLLINGEKLSITCSIGFCLYPFTPNEEEESGWNCLVELADAALYEAKRRGRNQAVAALYNTKKAPPDFWNQYSGRPASAIEDGAVHFQ